MSFESRISSLPLWTYAVSVSLPRSRSGRCVGAYQKTAHGALLLPGGFTDAGGCGSCRKMREIVGYGWMECCARKPFGKRPMDFADEE